MTKYSNVNIPEAILEKDEIKSLRTAYRSAYNYNIIHELFKANPERAFAAREIHDILSISPHTIEKYLIQLVGERKVFQIIDNTSVFFQINGKIAHTIKSASFSLIDRSLKKDYEITVLFNSYTPIIQVQEVENTDNGKKILGAIEIPGKLFDKFINELREAIPQVKSASNKMVDEHVRL